MLKDYQVNIFVRVIKRKLEYNQELILEDIFNNDYPSLTQEARDQIETKITNS